MMPQYIVNPLSLRLGPLGGSGIGGAYELPELTRLPAAEFPHLPITWRRTQYRRRIALPT